MSNVLFITRSFGGGGAESVVASLMDEAGASPASRNVHRLILVSNSSYNDDKNTHLDAISALRSIPLLFNFLRDSEFDVVISNLTYVNIITIFLNFFLRKNLFCVEHNIVFSKPYRHYTQPLYIRVLARLLYNYPAGLICVSTGVAADISKFYKVSKEKVHVINNPISVRYCGISKEYSSAAPFIYFGAHSYQKGIEDLLLAYDQYYSQSHDPRPLVIYGRPNCNTGSYSALISKFSSKASISFGGFVDPLEAVMASHCVVVPSRWEGFCNVVAESIIIGSHVIATTCHSGPAEIVENLREGELYTPGDVRALADKMIFLDEKRYVKRAFGYSEYTPAEVYKRYINLVETDA